MHFNCTCKLRYAHISFVNIFYLRAFVYYYFESMLPYTYFFIDLMLFVVIQIKLHSNLCSNYIYFFNDRTLILVSLSDKHNKNKD